MLDRPRRIALMAPRGTAEEPGLNGMAWRALQRAEREWGATIAFATPPSLEAAARTLDRLALDGYDTLVSVGEELTEATARVAADYPGRRFIAIDQVIASDNQVGVQYDEDRAGFLAGALAAELSPRQRIGGVFGASDSGRLQKYAQGYRAGARCVRPDSDVRLWLHPGSLEAGATDPAAGRQAAERLLDQGVDILFAVGGPTATAALLAAAERGVWVIGGDSDRYRDLVAARPVLLSSAVKDVEQAIYERLLAIRHGRFVGEVTYGQVGLAPYHDLAERVPAPVQARLAAIAAALRDGRLKTGVWV